MVDVQSSSKIKLVPDSDERWEKCRHGDLTAKNSIIEESLPLLDQVVGSMIGKFPAHVEAEELRSYGVFGLIKAVDTYNPHRATFRTHAVFLIKNSIYDELRKQDWAPKTFRARMKEIDAATAVLRTKLGREPSDAEVGRSLGKDEHYVRTARQEQHASHHKSIGEMVDANGEPSPLLRAVSAAEPSREARVYMHGMAQWVDSLPQHQQVIWALRFYKDLPPLAIAKKMHMRQTDVQAEVRQILASFGKFVEDIRSNS